VEDFITLPVSRSNSSELIAAILNGSLRYPDPFPDCCTRLYSWIARKSPLDILPPESNQIRGDCILLDSAKLVVDDSDTASDLAREHQQPHRASAFFLFQNMGFVIEDGEEYIEFYEDDITLFREIKRKYDSCKIEWHNCDDWRQGGKCAPHLRMVELNATHNVSLAPSSLFSNSNANSLILANYWAPTNLWHSLYDDLLPIVMTSLLWCGDRSKDVDWLEVLRRPTKEERLRTLKDIEKILLLSDKRANFNDRKSLFNRRTFKFLSVGYLKTYFSPVKWEGWRTVYAEPMISFYPCAAKRLRQYYNLSFQPPVRERIDPLVVYLERDVDNSNRKVIMQAVEELTVFGRPIKCVSVNPRNLTTEEMVRLMANASAVLGTEGAAFANSLFLAPGSGVFVIENREAARRFPSLYHRSVGRYLQLAVIQMKFVSDNNESIAIHLADPNRVRRGLEVLLRRIEINRESQLLTGKIGEFAIFYDRND
jgi:hypothetical protein